MALHISAIWPQKGPEHLIPECLPLSPDPSTSIFLPLSSPPKPSSASFPLPLPSLAAHPSSQNGINSCLAHLSYRPLWETQRALRERTWSCGQPWGSPAQSIGQSGNIAALNCSSYLFTAPRIDSA